METRWIRVKVHPGTKKNVLVALGVDRFEAWVKAKPMEGRANEALIALLVRQLQIPRERLHLMKGWNGPQKIFKIIG